MSPWVGIMLRPAWDPPPPCGERLLSSSVCGSAVVSGIDSQPCLGTQGTLLCGAGGSVAKVSKV